MYLYRYTSGDRRPGTKKPKMDAYFVSPDYSEKYPDPNILTSFFTLGTQDHPVSYLNPRGADEKVFSALTSLRWVIVSKEDVPPPLRLSKSLIDNYPHASEWYRAEVPETFIAKLEAEIEAIPLEVRQPPKVSPRSKITNFQIGLITILILLLAYIYFTRR